MNAGINSSPLRVEVGKIREVKEKSQGHRVKNY
jgi:hypothetical protein